MLALPLRRASFFTDSTKRWVILKIRMTDSLRFFLRIVERIVYLFLKKENSR